MMAKRRVVKRVKRVLKKRASAKTLAAATSLLKAIADHNASDACPVPYIPRDVCEAQEPSCSCEDASSITSDDFNTPA